MVGRNEYEAEKEAREKRLMAYTEVIQRRGIEAGDDVEVDFDSGMIYNKTKGTEFKGQAFPEFMQKIIKAEGLVNYINSQN